VHGRTLALTALTVLVHLSTAQAATFSADCSTLQNTMDAIASAGDTINVSSATPCTPTYNISKRDLTIDGGGTTVFSPTVGRAFDSSNVGNLVLRNMIVRGNGTDNGGVALSLDSTPTIENVTFQSNHNPARATTAGRSTSPPTRPAGRLP